MASGYIVVPSVVAIVVLGVAGYFLVAGGHRLVAANQLVRTELLPISDCSNHRGSVWVAGQAFAGDDGTVRAPLSGAQCLAYSYDIEVYVPDKRILPGGWETLDSGTETIPFAVDDGTGRVAVDSSETALQLESRSVTSPMGAELSDAFARRVAATDAVDSSQTTGSLGVPDWDKREMRRFTESRIEVGETVYVRGRTGPVQSETWNGTPVDAQLTGGAESNTVLVSDRDRSGTAWRVDRDGLWRIAVGISLIASVVGVTMLAPT